MAAIPNEVHQLAVNAASTNARLDALADKLEHTNDAIGNLAKAIEKQAESIGGLKDHVNKQDSELLAKINAQITARAEENAIILKRLRIAFWTVVLSATAHGGIDYIKPLLSALLGGHNG